MNKMPIGVFDSGLGGLTVVRQLLAELPHENIIYFGDTGRVPYGNRSRDTIRKYAAQDFQFLLSKKVKMVIAGCGTVSSVAQDIGDALPVDYTGVVPPAVKAALAATKNGKVGVIGTTATIRSGAYEKQLKAWEPSVEIYTQDCPLFVPLVENGFIRRDETVTHLIAEKYLSSLRDKGVDTLILGCTHYPLISHIIADIMGEGVSLIDTGREAALWASEILTKKHLLNSQSAQGRREFFVSDEVDSFSAIGAMFLDLGGPVRHIDIEQYPPVSVACL